MSTTVDPAVVQSSSTTNNGGAADWRATLPEELRSEKSLESFKDIPSLAKSFVDTKRMVGNAIHMPKPDAKPEDWDGFYSKIGRPETPDKYEFKRPETPENVKYDEEMETAFKTLAHKAGLHPRQAQSLLEGYNALQVERIKNFTGKMEQGVGELKKEWGGKFDTNVSTASRAVKELGGPEIVSLLEETGLGNHPALIKFFAKLGESIAEDAIIVGDQPPDESSRDAITLKLNEILNDPKHPYNDTHAPHEARQAAMRTVSGYYKQLYPEKQRA